MASDLSNGVLSKINSKVEVLEAENKDCKAECQSSKPGSSKPRLNKTDLTITLAVTCDA